MATNEPISFGPILSRYRVASGLTQEDLAERAGLSARGISDLERGVNRSPRAQTVRQLADALQLSPDDRALFLRAAGAARSGPEAGDMPRVGDFLGALPGGPVVGRDEELVHIRIILDAVLEGAGQVILLSGEAGAGKTRLAQEVMVEAAARGMVVLTGRCYSSERSTPYYPVIGALAQMSTALPESVRAEGQRGWKRVQSALSRVPGGDSAVSNGLPAQQFFEAVTDLLLGIARRVPLALLIDDLHWADDGSLKLVHHIARASRSAPILVAASFRDVQVTEDSPVLAEMLLTFSRERLAERVIVRRLSFEETTSLAAALMGGPVPSEEFASFVYRRTKGVPRLVNQLVRSLGGRLALQGEIGAGSMGRVFRALDRVRDEIVAAKLVLARSEIDLDSLLRFQQEGAVLARLDHPHIVRIYDTFVEEHASCIIMELLDGRPLGSALDTGPLPLSRAKVLAVQVADALSYAHSQGIVHRDIKPDNIIVLSGDQVKVTDFGIARILQPDISVQPVATTGMRLGTPLYMAPEQIEGATIDGRADIYALGAMLYHMATGRPPFEGNDALSIAIKHLQEEPVPPSQVDPAIPAGWDTVVLRAMAKDPAQRFQRAGEIREAIAALPAERVDARAQGQDGIVAEAIAQGSPATRARLTRVPRRSRARAAIFAVCMATVAALGIVLTHPWPSPRVHASGTKPVAVWGVKIPSGFHFSTVETITPPFHGNIYLGNWEDGTVLRVSTTGRLLGAWGTRGTKPGQIENVNDLATDKQGNVYVADETNDRVTKFSPDGTFLAAFGRPGFDPGEFSHPSALAIDAAGNMYVADTYNDRIQKLSPAGKPLLVWGSPGPGPNQVHGPNVIRLDAQGNVWVAEHVNRRIHEFSPAGTSLKMFGTGGRGHGQFTDIQGLGIDPQGNIYGLDQTLGSVQKFTPSGKFLAVWDSHGSGPGQFKAPVSISFDRQGHIYVADAGNGRVDVLSSDGKPVAEWTVRGLLRPLFVRPSYIALDRQGDTYTTDAGRNAVEKLSPGGALLARWGRFGTGRGQFRGPCGIALDAAGHVYVADTGNGRIQEFTSGGAFMTAWTVKIEGAKRRSSPTGLAVDSSGRIYVTDPMAGVVQGYSRPGVLHIQWGRSNADHPMYRLEDPTGVAVDREGNVYVADSGNHRVVEFAAADLRGTSLPEGHATASWGGSTGAGRMLRPVGVAVDARGHVYVTDASAARIELLQPNGAVPAGWGRRGSDPGQFQGPAGIALDSAGNIYVVDSGNARIQKFPSVH